MKKRIALMMAAVMAAGALLAGCGGNDSNRNNTSAAKEADLTYAVEAGSAGEATRCRQACGAWSVPASCARRPCCADFRSDSWSPRFSC